MRNCHTFGIAEIQSGARAQQGRKSSGAQAFKKHWVPYPTRPLR